MAQSFIVEVTQDHINKGQRGFPNRCPLAYALDDAGIRSPHVGPASWTSPFDQGGWLTGKARNFLYRFDHLLPVKPGQYRFYRHF